ncbi:MAG TPA: ArsR family transcriptional regulator [Streptosporangiaceae bacterium]|jgi:DNA-binding transcriptional ArsR family regulator
MSTPLYQLKAEFFKTLGHPARIRILELLSERDHTVAEMLPEVGIEPAHLSQQLAALAEPGEWAPGRVLAELPAVMSPECQHPATRPGHNRRMA